MNTLHYLISALFIMMSANEMNASLECSKVFTKRGLLIRCKKATTSKSIQPKFNIKYTKKGELAAPEDICSVEDSIIHCQQMIALKYLGIGKHELFAEIYYRVSKMYRYTATIPIVIDFPKVDFDNCSQVLTKENKAHCTCRRTDASEIETRIFIKKDEVILINTTNSHSSVDFAITETTILRCSAENLAGWKSTIVSVKFNISLKERPDEGYSYSDHIAIITFILLIAPTLLFLLYDRLDQSAYDKSLHQCVVKNVYRNFMNDTPTEYSFEFTRILNHHGKFLAKIRFPEKDKLQFILSGIVNNANSFDFLQRALYFKLELSDKSNSHFIHPLEWDGLRLRNITFTFSRQKLLELNVIKNDQIKTSWIIKSQLNYLEQRIFDDGMIQRETLRKSKHRLKEYVFQYVTKKPEKIEDYSRSELLQCLAKIFEQNDDELNEMLPLYPHLKEKLTHADPDEQLFTTQCLRELSRNKEASHQIIRDDELNATLAKLVTSNDLSANVHSIFWRAGRTTGILPTKTDVFSDEFPKQFEIKETSIAGGSYGSVHLVVDRERPQEERFVAKKTRADLKNQKKLMESLQSEASILIKLKHKNIVQFHGFQKKESDTILFLEYLKMGSLSTFIKQRKQLTEDMTRQFTIQILEGVKYLHENNVLHLNINGNNILMVDESNIKLTDFGLSMIFTVKDGVEAERGTTRYMAPEMINCPDGRIFENAFSLDIWSVGSTVVEMITGSPPNATTPSANVLFKIAMLQKPKYDLPANSSQNLKDFLEKTFKPRAEERPSAETLLREDPFITG